MVWYRYGVICGTNPIHSHNTVTAHYWPLWRRWPEREKEGGGGGVGARTFVSQKRKIILCPLWAQSYRNKVIPLWRPQVRLRPAYIYIYALTQTPTPTCYSFLPLISWGHVLTLKFCLNAVGKLSIGKWMTYFEWNGQ